MSLHQSVTTYLASLRPGLPSAESRTFFGSISELSFTLEGNGIDDWGGTRWIQGKVISSRKLGPGEFAEFVL